MRRCGGRLLRRRNHNRHGVPQLHHVIHQHLNIVNTGSLELNLSEYRDICRASGRFPEGELHLSLPQHSRLVRRHETSGFIKLAYAGRPLVEQAELESHDRQLRNPDHVDDAKEEEIARNLLAHLFAKKRALKVRQNASRLHGIRLAIRQAMRVAARTVLRMSNAMVMGPTPPGFGVIFPAIG